MPSLTMVILATRGLLVRAALFLFETEMFAAAGSDEAMREAAHQAAIDLRVKWLGPGCVRRAERIVTSGQ